MAKFEITVMETVWHKHRLIIDCENMESAEMIADCMKDEKMEHPDDVLVAAKNSGSKVLEFNRDYSVETDDIEIWDITEVKED